MKEYVVRFQGPEKVEKFVQITNAYDYNVDLVYGKYIIDAKSIMGVFTLNLSKPVNLVVHSEECEDMVQKLKDNAYII